MVLAIERPQWVTNHPDIIWSHIVSTASNGATPSSTPNPDPAAAASGSEQAVMRGEVNRLHRAVCGYADRMQYIASVLRSDGKRMVEETAEIRMRELDAATNTIADLQEQVKTVDANAAIVAAAVPSLLKLLENDHPGNYCEMSATASDGTPVVITYQRSDRRTPHDLRIEAEAQRDAALGRVESLNKDLATRQGKLERALQERSSSHDAYLGVLQDADTIAEHAEACGVVSTPAYDLAVRRVAERTSSSPVPALRNRVRELEQQLAERERLNDEDFAKLEEAVALGSQQAEEYDTVLAQRDARVAELEARDQEIAGRIDTALAAWMAPTTTGKSAYPDAIDDLSNALARRFTPDQLAILHRAMRPHAKAGFNAHFVDPADRGQPDPA